MEMNRITSAPEYIQKRDRQKQDEAEMLAEEAAWRAGGVFVKQMSESEAMAWAQNMWLAGEGANVVEYSVAVMRKLGITYPDPIRTPLEIAKEEYPEANPEMLERLQDIFKGDTA